MDLSVIVPKNDLSKDVKLCEIKSKIIDRLEKIAVENLQEYKHNNEFLVLACNLIEFHCKKKYGIDKLQLAISIYDRIFANLTDDEKETIKKNIQFIWNNGHIKKISVYRLFYCGAKEWFKKKFS